MEEALTIESFAQQLTNSSEPDQPEEESPDAAEAQDDGEVDLQGQSEEEADADAEQSEQDSADEYLTFKGDDGQDVQVSKDDALQAWKNAKSQQADYTRKTQALAEERKSAQQQFQQQMQFAAQFSQAFGNQNALAQRVQQLEGLDWNALHQQDPMQFIQLRAELDDARINLNRVSDAINQQRGQFQEWQAQALREQQSEVWTHMREVDSKFNRESLQSMFEDAGKYGFEFAELNQISDKRLVHMWHDLYTKAKAYDALQTKKPEVTNAVKKLPPKVVKSGSAKPATHFEQGMRKLSQGGGVRDLAAMLSATRRK